MAIRALVVAALLLWGYGTGALLAAVGLALLLEAPPLLRLQSGIEPAGYCRVADFTSLLFAGLAIFCFTRYGVFGIYRILEWLPYCLLLPLLVQRLGDRGRTPLGALFFGLRRRGWDAGTIDWSGPYFACCLLAATFGANPFAGYFAITVALLFGYLLATRPGAGNPLALLPLILFCAAAAWAAHTSLQYALARMELLAEPWFRSFQYLDRNPNQTTTAIGSLGRIKASAVIQVRVHARQLTIPLYLHEASYNEFRNGIWTARGTPPAALDVDAGGHAWTLAPTVNPELLDISVQHRREVAVVPTPLNLARIEGQEIVEVQRSSLGTLLIEAPPGAVRYRAYTSAGVPPAEVATNSDLALPTGYRDAIVAIARTLDLDALPPAAAIARIERYFATDFRYALPGATGAPWRKTLADFLLRDRTGHCEYFATATVLLVRAAGIPARYDVGYLVQEYSPWERAWIARARHRHAWASVYLDGGWRIIDTTPPAWLDLEREAAGGHWLTDVYAWVRYRIARIGRDAADADVTPLLWLLPPLLLLLFWRLSHGDLRLRRRSEAALPVPGPSCGADSELFHLIDRHRRLGNEFLPGETLTTWLRRVLPATPERDRLLALHYRYRFDPVGLTLGEREELRLLSERRC